MGKQNPSTKIPNAKKYRNLKKQNSNNHQRLELELLP
jgi:hypothetical protein